MLITVLTWLPFTIIAWIIYRKYEQKKINAAWFAFIGVLALLGTILWRLIVEFGIESIGEHHFTPSNSIATAASQVMATSQPTPVNTPVASSVQVAEPLVTPLVASQPEPTQEISGAIKQEIESTISADEEAAEKRARKRQFRVCRQGILDVSYYLEMAKQCNFTTNRSDEFFLQKLSNNSCDDVINKKLAGKIYVDERTRLRKIFANKDVEEARDFCMEEYLKYWGKLDRN